MVSCDVDSTLVMDLMRSRVKQQHNKILDKLKKRGKLNLKNIKVVYT